MTRSDEGIERLLEDWLEAEAQPMPLDVLEGVLESVARTPQALKRGGIAGWLTQGPIGVLGAAAVLLLVVVAGGLAVNRIGSFIPTASSQPSASAGPVLTWAQDEDFLAVPGENPAPDSYGNPAVWTYLRSFALHLPSAYEVLQDFADSQWTDSLVTVYSDRGLVLAPSRDGQGAHYVILGWKSPITGEVAIRGSADLLQRTCPAAADGVRLFIDRGLETLDVRDIPAGQTSTFTIDVTVASGDSIFFIVDPLTNSNCDETAMNFLITGKGR